MKAFRFRLQAALDHRKSVEERLLMELSNLRRELESAEQDRERLRIELERRSADLNKLLSTGAPAGEAATADNYIQDLRDRIALRSLDIASLDRKIEAKTLDVMTATQARKTIERLKETQSEKHRKMAEREEQKGLDDVAAIRYARARD